MRAALKVPRRTTEEVVGLRRLVSNVVRSRLVCLVIKIQPTERPIVGELMLHLEGVHVRQVDRLG